MVNDLHDLMHDASRNAPHDLGDIGAVLHRGRSRVRVRRVGIAGGTALAVGAISLVSLGWLNPATGDLTSAQVTRPGGHSVQLSDALPAVEGTDYRLLTSTTNESLDRDNGQRLDGVTDDGLILFRDGPRSGQLFPRFALMDPGTGIKDWLPALDIGQHHTTAVELGEERLVLFSTDSETGGAGNLMASSFDRATRRWSRTTWPGLPSTDRPSMTAGPDGRLYTPIPTTQASPRPGDADGDTFDLWSVSPTDGTDVRDEHLRVGAIGFTDTSLVWTDSTNGATSQVHVRDLTSGVETSFDPQLGEGCDVIDIEVAGEHLSMLQFCGLDDSGLRDDRVQVMTTDGEQVVNALVSGLAYAQLSADGGFLTLMVDGPEAGGTYLYDTTDGRFIKISDATSSWETGGGPSPEDLLLWSTPVNRGHGATTWLGELL